MSFEQKPMNILVLNTKQLMKTLAVSLLSFVHVRNDKYVYFK